MKITQRIGAISIALIVASGLSGCGTEASGETQSTAGGAIETGPAKTEQKESPTAAKTTTQPTPSAPVPTALAPTTPAAQKEVVTAPAAAGKTATPPKLDPKPEMKPAPKPELSGGQSNAIGSAKSYLSFMHFSRSGLIDQLKYEGYSTEDSTFAVDSVSPNWNEQAAGPAADYLDFMSFSRSGLIDQLLYEGFTQAQAEYGVKEVGY